MRAFTFIVAAFFSVAPALAAESYIPEPAFQLAWTFGGAAQEAGRMKYRFELNHDRRVVNQRMPAIVTLDVNLRNLALQLSGIPLMSHKLRLDQNATAEAPTTAETEDGGFLSDAGDFVQGLGVGTGAVLLAGAAGIGLILLSTDADETANGNNSGEPRSSPCGSRGGIADDGEGNCILACPGPGPNSCIGNTLIGQTNAALAFEPHEPEWMLTGSGQMGDLFLQ